MVSGARRLLRPVRFEGFEKVRIHSAGVKADNLGDGQAVQSGQMERLHEFPIYTVLFETDQISRPDMAKTGADQFRNEERSHSLNPKFDQVPRREFSQTGGGHSFDVFAGHAMDAKIDDLFDRQARVAEGTEVVHQLRVDAVHAQFDQLAGAELTEPCFVHAGDEVRAYAVEPEIGQVLKRQLSVSQPADLIDELDVDPRVPDGNQLIDGELPIPTLRCDPDGRGRPAGVRHFCAEVFVDELGYREPLRQQKFFRHVRRCGS